MCHTPFFPMSSHKYIFFPFFQITPAAVAPYCVFLDCVSHTSRFYSVFLDCVSHTSRFYSVFLDCVSHTSRFYSVFLDCVSHTSRFYSVFLDCVSHTSRFYSVVCYSCVVPTLSFRRNKEVLDWTRVPMPA